MPTNDSVALTLYNVSIGEYLYKPEVTQWRDLEENGIDGLDLRGVFCDGYVETPGKTSQFLLSDETTGKVTYKVFYSTGNEMPFFWNGFLQSANETIPSLWSKRPSFIMFILHVGTSEKSTKLYAIVGGSGYHDISGHVNNLFGFDIIARLLTPEDKKREFIKYIENKNLIGNVDFESRSFRRLYSVMYDNSYWSLYKDMILSLDEDLLEKLGITELSSVNKKNKVGVAVTSGFHLKKRVGFDTLLGVIRKISGIYEMDPQIAFNKLEHVSATYHKDELKEVAGFSDTYILRELFRGKNKSNFSIGIQGTDWFADSVSLTYGHDTHEVEFGSGGDVGQDILSTVISIYEGNITEAERDVETFIGNLKFVGAEQKSYGSIKGALEFEFEMPSGKKYFRIAGEYYSVKNELGEIVNNDFSQFYTDPTKFLNSSDTKLSKVWLSGDEAEYNESYGDEEGFIVFDKVNPAPWSVEVCDLMYVDEVTREVHIYHVKDGFGQSIRDLAYQVQISTQLIRDYMLDRNNDGYLKKVYETAYARNPKMREKFPSLSDFLEIFHGDVSKLRIFAGIRYQSNDGDFSAANTIIPKVSLLDLQKKLISEHGIENFAVIKIAYQD